MGKWVVYNKSNDKLITESWGNFLGCWLWDFFTTFTIRDAIKVKDRFIDRRVTLLSAKRFAERYLQENDTNGNLEYFLAIESEGFSTPHIHMLIRGVKQLDRWKHGRADIKRYDAKLGARHYVVKYITSKYVDYDFSLKPESKSAESDGTGRTG